MIWFINGGNMFKMAHYELAAHLVDYDLNETDDMDDIEVEGELEERLYDKYDISTDDFDNLIDDLFPLCNKHPCTFFGGTHRGFSTEDDGHIFWLARVKK